MSKGIFYHVYILIDKRKYFCRYSVYRENEFLYKGELENHTDDKRYSVMWIFVEEVIKGVIDEIGNDFASIVVHCNVSEIVYFMSKNFMGEYIIDVNMFSMAKHIENVRNMLKNYKFMFLKENATHIAKVISGG